MLSVLATAHDTGKLTRLTRLTRIDDGHRERPSAPAFAPNLHSLMPPFMDQNQRPESVSLRQP